MTWTFGSVFSGIGGIDLGLERAGWSPLWNSEIASLPSRVLARRWPAVPNLGDITSIDWSAVERPDLICGGYPCPAFSQAARGRNVAPDLWPHMRRAIAALRPRFVLLENVRAHLGRGFPAVLADLHALGLNAEWSVVPACSVGAPHARDRLYCVAYTDRGGESARAFDDEASWFSTDGDSGRGWPAAPERLGMADGVPDRLDRLRGLGNAALPQVSQRIGEHLMRMTS